MSLTVYKRKRSFDDTPEPSGTKKTKAAAKALSFVVQKHDASRLHYDFRLEMGGVLKSWAVPKGPSLNPNDKRLAMMVEDHPYDYRSFEGTIPEGNYGAGTVIVWDNGTYEPLEEVPHASKQEKLLLKQLRDGNLKFRLHGKKLKGEFALVLMKGRQENAWLLIKKNDEFASPADVLKRAESVVSGKNIEDVALSTRTARADPISVSSKKKSASSTAKKINTSGKKKVGHSSNKQPKKVATKG